MDFLPPDDLSEVQKRFEQSRPASKKVEFGPHTMKDIPRPAQHKPQPSWLERGKNYVSDAIDGLFGGEDSLPPVEVNQNNDFLGDILGNTLGDKATVYNPGYKADPDVLQTTEGNTPNVKEGPKPPAGLQSLPQETNQVAGNPEATKTARTPVVASEGSEDDGSVKAGVVGADGNKADGNPPAPNRKPATVQKGPQAKQSADQRAMSDFGNDVADQSFGFQEAIEMGLGRRSDQTSSALMGNKQPIPMPKFKGGGGFFGGLF